MKNDIIYSLNIADLQNVALQEIDRLLSEDEILISRKLIEDKINWYDALANSINEALISNIIKVE